MRAIHWYTMLTTSLSYDIVYNDHMHFKIILKVTTTREDMQTCTDS